jgi:hypothetical protein
MATLAAIPTGFARLAGLIDGHGRARIAVNTTAYRWDDHTIAVALYGHTIVLVHDDDTVSLRHAGYVTATTFDRLHRFLPPGWAATRAGGNPRVVHIATGETVALDADTWTRVA